MSAPARGDAADHSPSACENCGTWLQGGHCHLCGQSAHSPVRSVGHAVEEVFESFWHLDGRVFRTLRDLFVPGRVADAYLAGHRVRYIAPMRLFVILTALTIFVAKLMLPPMMEGAAAPAAPAAPALDAAREAALALPGDAAPADANGSVPAPATGGADAAGSDPAPAAGNADADAEAPQAEAGPQVAFAGARSVAEVERQRDEALRELDEAARLPLVGLAVRDARARIEDAADARIVALGGVPDPARRSAGAAGDGGSAAGEGDAAAEAPARLHPFERMERNLQRFDGDWPAALRFLIGAAPTTLFVLVPLFALLLKIFYLFSRRLYLEHLVIALYSHVYLMLALLLIFLCSALAGRVPALAAPLGWATTLLAWSMPLYLLWMQRRVYRQSWTTTLLKYSAIGIAYSVLFGFVALGVLGFSLFAL